MGRSEETPSPLLQVVDYSVVQKQSVSRNYISLAEFGESIGRSRPTVWRWRKRGWLETIQILDRHYITAEEVARFHQRASAGEFKSEVTK